MSVDWLAFSRDCVADIDAALERLPTRVEREPVLGAGEGGDDTTAIDAAAEDAVVARLEALGADLVLVSEELGERTFGAGGPMRVVVDPIDGSVNCKRGIPFFSFSLAVADGATMDDVQFGLRVRLRLARGVGGDPGRRRPARRRAADGTAAEGPDRDPLAGGHDDRRSSRTGRRR